MDDPWWPLGLGLMAQVLGGLMVALASSQDKGGLLPVGWIVVAAGDLPLLVGVVGLGVLIGQRAWADEQRRTEARVA